MTAPALGGRAQAYYEASRAPRTRDNYLFEWRRWEKWCAIRGCAPWPALPHDVAAYVVDCADRGNRVSTIRVRLSAIACYHADHGWEPVTRDPDVVRLVAGVARTQAGETPAQVTGLTSAALKVIEGSVNLKRPIECMNLALCWVMRDALLRSSEAVALVWDDVEPLDDGSGRLLVRRSKTDQLGVGHVAYLSPGSMAALERIWPDPPAPDARIFPLQVRDVARRIQSTARRAGLIGRYRGHSPRIGMAADLAASGASIVELQQVGRWKSARMPAYYIRKQEASRSAVARFYRGTHGRNRNRTHAHPRATAQG